MQSSSASSNYSTINDYEIIDELEATYTFRDNSATLEEQHIIESFDTTLLYPTTEDDNSRGNHRTSGGLPVDGCVGTALDRLFLNTFTFDGSEVGVECSPKRRRSADEEIFFPVIDSVKETMQEVQRSKIRYPVADLVREIQRVIKKRGIFHEIIYTSSPGRVFKNIKCTLEGGSTANVFIICWHPPDHFHLVHDCQGHEKRCKCTRPNSIRGNQRPLRRFVLGSAISSEWWQNLLLYFQSHEREYLLLEIGGNEWIRSDKIGGVQDAGDHLVGQNAMVEESSSTIYVCHQEQSGSPEGPNRSSPVRSGQADGDAPGRRQGSKEEQLLTFLKTYPTAPLKHIRNLTVFKKSKFFYWDFKKHYFKKMLERYSDFINDLAFHEVRDFTLTCKPYYNAPNGLFDSYYYGMEESIDILYNLLQFQAKHNNFNAHLFMWKLHDVLAKNTRKQNTFLVIGPPNSGKNFFFDAVIHAQFNFGQIGNFDKYNSFPLMEACNKRVLLWNEPQVEVGQTETLKMLLGGDTLNVKVKYEDDTIMTRTPIIVLANYAPFPNGEAFRTRIIRYQWSTAAYLRDMVKKPNPAAVWHLFRRMHVNLTDYSDVEDSYNSENDVDPFDTGDNEFTTFSQ